MTEWSAALANVLSWELWITTMVARVMAIIGVAVGCAILTIFVVITVALWRDYLRKVRADWKAVCDEIP